jgi:hypothetical protein
MPVANAVGLWGRREFLDDSKAIYCDVLDVPPFGDRDVLMDKRSAEKIEKRTSVFYEKWGAGPAPILVRDDPLLGGANLAVAFGQWGLIPVYRWTKEADVQEARRRIQRIIGRTHKDARNTRRAIVASWLLEHSDSKGQPISRETVGRAVWGRKDGWRRLTTEKAIARLPFSVEQEWMSSYGGRGLRRAEATRQVYRRAKGTEAKAAGQLRKALSRGRRGRVADPNSCDVAALCFTSAIIAASIMQDLTETRRFLFEALRRLVAA